MSFVWRAKTVSYSPFLYGSCAATECTKYYSNSNRGLAFSCHPSIVVVVGVAETIDTFGLHLHNAHNRELKLK